MANYQTVSVRMVVRQRSMASPGFHSGMTAQTAVEHAVSSSMACKIAQGHRPARTAPALVANMEMLDNHLDHRQNHKNHLHLQLNHFP